MKKLFSSGTFVLLLILIIRNIAYGSWSDPKEFIYDTLVTLPGIIIGLSFHEFGHAIASNKLGDPTPKLQGRVTINPLAHIDPFGFVAIIICGFGWGKPVMIDPRYYKNPRRDEFIVSIAGVTVNLIIAVIFSIVLRFFVRANYGVSMNDMSVTGIIFNIIIYIIYINIVLMIFNLIPVPPLDGFGVITQIFDLKKQSWYHTVYQYGMSILMILMIFGIVGKVITPLTRGIFNFLIDTIVR